jgi:hypothetical protein
VLGSPASCTRPPAQPAPRHSPAPQPTCAAQLPGLAAQLAEALLIGEGGRVAAAVRFDVVRVQLGQELLELSGVGCQVRRQADARVGLVRALAVARVATPVAGAAAAGGGAGWTGTGGRRGRGRSRRRVLESGLCASSIPLPSSMGGPGTARPPPPLPASLGCPPSCCLITPPSPSPALAACDAPLSAHVAQHDGPGSIQQDSTQSAAP